MGLQFELIDQVTYRMILIQFHTLPRPAEIATLKWEYIDFDTALSHLVGNEVSRTYNKDKAIKQRREMLNYWSDYLESKSK